MKCAILCGGKGMRMGADVERVPKPLLDINGIPMVLRIMNHYRRYGVKDFILLLGHQAEVIKEYFVNYDWKKNDFHVDLASGDIKYEKNKIDIRVSFIDTGLNSQTGSRIAQIEKYITDDDFFLTYGDGLSNVDINALLQLHKEKKKAITVTGVFKRNQYGVLEIDGDTVTNFTEKDMSNDIINGGFFVVNKSFFKYLTNDPNCILEDEPLKQAISENNMAVYIHRGFWKSVDTRKDLSEIRKAQLEDLMQTEDQAHDREVA